MEIRRVPESGETRMTRRALFALVAAVFAERSLCAPADSLDSLIIHECRRGLLLECVATRGWHEDGSAFMRVLYGCINCGARWDIGLHIRAGASEPTLALLRSSAKTRAFWLTHCGVAR
jgi:hypothetical protein